MREIKFRAWDKKNKLMLPETWGNFVFNFNGFLCIEDGQGEVLNKAEEVILLQDTGLKDKQGTEILEGGIVRFFENRSERRVQVKIDPLLGVAPFNWMYGYENDIPFLEYAQEVEIIGNAHENPELLR